MNEWIDIYAPPCSFVLDTRMVLSLGGSGKSPSDSKKSQISPDTMCY
jgi:hypothetical protein